MVRYILIGLLLFTLILGLSVGYIIIKFFPRELPSLVLALDLKNLLLSLLFLFLYHTFDTLRVLVLARALGIKYSLWYGYIVSFINTFGATVTPAHLGGEILPLYTLSRKGGHFYQILSLVTMKSISGFTFYVIMFPLTLKALLENPKEAKELLILVISISLILLSIYIIYKTLLKRESFSRGALFYKFKRLLLRYIVTSKLFLKTKKVYFFYAILLSFFLYLSFLLLGIFLLKSFNPSITTFEVFMKQLPLLYAIFISPTPGGSGVGELGAIPIFENYLPSNLLGPFVLLWRLLSQYLSAFIGGIIFLFFLLKDIKKNNVF